MSLFLVKLQYTVLVFPMDTTKQLSAVSGSVIQGSANIALDLYVG